MKAELLLLALFICCGRDGTNGKDGVNGYSAVSEIISQADGCVTILIANDTNRNGILDTSDTNIQSGTVCDGETPAYTIVDIFDPCGDAPGIIDEVLLLLPDGQYLASVSDSFAGDNTRLALIPPGSYVTTDGSQCHFTIYE